MGFSQPQQLGGTGISVAPLMLGLEALAGYDWGDLDPKQVEDATRYAFDLGFTFCDVADCYGLGLAEERLGAIMTGRRQEIVVGTKFGVRVEGGKTRYDNSPTYMRTAIEASLKRLGTDYIDLYQLHWPDNQTPFDDVIAQFQRFFEEGKVRAYGLSNRTFSAEELSNLPAEFVSHSLEYSLANRSNETQIASVEENSDLSFLSWGTLGQGVLSGKYSAQSKFSANDRRSKGHWLNFQDAQLARNMQIVEVMKSVFEELDEADIPLTAIAIRWNMERFKRAIPIVGFKSRKQVEGNAKALTIQLSDAALAKLDAVSSGSMQRD